MNMHPSHTINALVTALNIGFHNSIQNSPLINFNIFLESTGYVEGSHNQKGGVSNRVCLTCDLIYEKNLSSRYVSKIYGLNIKNSLEVHDVLCAVCHVVTRASQMMRPGRNVRPAGWTTISCQRHALRIFTVKWFRSWFVQ